MARETAGGGEGLSLFVHRNETDWIAWIPSGYYMSSSYGDNYIGWHINRGKETSPDFFCVVLFECVLYRPDLVTAVFGRSDRTTTRSLPPFDVSQLTSIAPPRIHIESTKLDADQRGVAVLNIRFSAERNSLPMKDYAIYVNNVPVTPRQDRHLTAGGVRGGGGGGGARGAAPPGGGRGRRAGGGGRGPGREPGGGRGGAARGAE